MTKSLLTISTKNKEDALKYAWAFMKTESLNMKECSFINPKPSQFNKDYLLPRDMYSASYSKDNLPSWEQFKTNPAHLSSPGFSCVACLDKKDQKRVVLAFLDGNLLFNCYGNYESEAKKAFESIKSIYLTIK